MTKHGGDQEGIPAPAPKQAEPAGHRPIVESAGRTLWDSPSAAAGFWGKLWDTPLGLLVADDSLVVDANASFLKMIGCDQDDLQCRRISWREIEAPDERRQDELMLAQLRDGRTACREKEWLARDGRRIPLLLVPAAVSSTPLRFVCAVWEQSQQRQRESQWREKIEQLTGRQRAKDQFMAMLAHELRNPLAAMRQALQLVEREPADAQDQQWVKQVLQRQLAQIHALVNDLMDISGIRQGKLRLAQEQVNLDQVVQQALETTAHIFSQRRHQLQVRQPAAPLAVLGDRLRLAQVLANLLNNAAKYTPPGGKVELTVVQDGEQAALHLRDNGLGIPRDMLEHIFELFTQVHNGPHAQGGLGLGLPLVRSLVQLHGGSVEARSDGPGTGSEFIVRLPLAKTQPAALQAMDEPPAATSPEASPPPPPVPRRILLVEDDLDGRESLSRLLQNLGHSVRVCGDGPSALEHALSFAPQAILLDIGLPGMDGYQLAQRLRGIPRLQGIALLAISGFGRDSDVARAHTCGFDGYMIKPPDLNQIQEWLDKLPGDGPATAAD